LNIKLKMTKPLCLLIDDEPDILELLVMTLKPMDIDCYTAETFAKAKKYLQTKSFDLCLTDMQLPDGNGLDIVKIIGQDYLQTPVAVLTAHGSIETAVQALKAGAFDFISKPLKVSELRDLVTTALHLKDRRDDPMANFIGEAKVILNLRKRITRLARSQAPIHINGETGVGKEVVARMIHELGARADKAFVPVNCGAIPSELMESEFFGHKKGSFTGASVNKLGLFQVADGGTLFLDEVAELPLPMQVKLMRVIQEKQVRPIGAQKEAPVNVRILSATHRNLEQLVKQNEFRQDLFFRINVIELFVPPLRERSTDIPILTKYILQKRYNQNPNLRLNRYQHPHLSKSAMSALKNYAFPGNVRELENILERAMTLCENDTIELKDLQLRKDAVKPKTAKVETPQFSDDDSDEFIPLDSVQPLGELLDKVERKKIFKVLEQTDGNKSQAAKLLGISLSALRHRLRKLNGKSTTVDLR